MFNLPIPHLVIATFSGREDSVAARIMEVMSPKQVQMLPFDMKELSLMHERGVRTKRAWNEAAKDWVRALEDDEA